jgi:glycosyltransferase involved in cell wall biosynthesis
MAGPPTQRRPATARRRFVVLSTCPEPWGGSEELWWAAVCVLRARGHEVDVLKTGVDPEHPRIRGLAGLACRVRELDRPASSRIWGAAGVLLPARYALDALRRQIVVAARVLMTRRPDLVVVSQGANFDGAHLARLCRRMRVPYVVISQKASELQWPADWVRAYLADVFVGAQLALFVSEHNRRLTEEQIGVHLDNAVVVRNPVLAGADGTLPWPAGERGPARLACVARLFVPEKGQDLLLRVLACERWRSRPLELSFFGDGPHRRGLEDLAARLGVTNVAFAGQTTDVPAIWRDHHALVLPSRAEGMPLAVVEAMMCGRMAIVTDVGGTAEIVEDGTTGFVAAAASIEAIDAALESAWARREEWPALGRHAARRIRELVPGDPGTQLADRLVAAAGPAIAKERMAATR